MSPLALFLIGLALPFAAAALIGTGLYLRRRRHKAIAKVQGKWGLYLESATPDSDLDHDCSFHPCQRQVRETERRATAARINGGTA